MLLHPSSSDPIRPHWRWSRTWLLLLDWAFAPTISGPGDWWRRLVVQWWVVGHHFSDLVIGCLLCPTRGSSYPDSPSSGGGDRWNEETTCSTCVDGCTALTSLREGRRNAAAYLRQAPTTTQTIPGLSMRWGGAGNSSNVRRGPRTCKRGGCQ